MRQVHAAAERVGQALRPTPSSMPVKISSSVAAKYQVKTSIAVNSTTPMPPTEIAQARSVRVVAAFVCEEWSHHVLFGGCGRRHSFDKRASDQDRVNALV